MHSVTALAAQQGVAAAEPQRVAIDLWEGLALALGRFGRATEALWLAAEPLVR
jgi:hypothetical protein